MLKALRKRVTYTSVAMTLALVFAMTGGAYAAKKYLITSTKQISPSVLKSLQGKAGKNGAAGVQGPAGPTGPQGSAGKDGGKGENGTDGKEGKEGPTGKEGPKGKEGSPWTTGNGVLPSEKTETGVWAIGHIEENAAFPGLGGPVDVPISFPLRLSAALTRSHVHIILANGEELAENFEEIKSTTCLGTAAEPTAEPGNLCVYTGKSTNTIIYFASFVDPATGENEGAAISGMDLRVYVQEKDAEASGTWAVTAE